MGNLLEHAKKELELYGAFDKKKDFYGGMTGKSVMQLMKVFEKQGHSGMSAPMVVGLFSKVANFKPLVPIMCTDEEWVEVSPSVFQNSRLSSVFKDGKKGKPYYLDAIVFRYSDGSAFTGTVEKISSRQFIKLPFIPKTFYIDVTEDGNKIKNKKQLTAALKYYNVK